MSPSGSPCTYRPVPQTHGPAGRDLAHLGAAESDRRDRTGLVQRRRDPGGQGRNHLTLECALEGSGIHSLFEADLLRSEVADRRVVLMDGMDLHAVRRRPGRGRQRLLEGVLALVGDADPVHGAQHDRIAGAQQYDPPRPQRQVPGSFHPLVGQFTAHGRRAVHVEGQQLQADQRGK